jgi:hypothetical protein
MLSRNDSGGKRRRIAATSTETVSPDFNYFDVPRRRLDTLCGNWWDFARTVFNLNDSNLMKRGPQFERLNDPVFAETYLRMEHRMEHEDNYDEVSVYWPGDELAGVDWVAGLVGRTRDFGTSCGTEGFVSGACS